jgi:hypothetical protein
VGGAATTKAQSPVVPTGLPLVAIPVEGKIEEMDLTSENVEEMVEQMEEWEDDQEEEEKFLEETQSKLMVAALKTAPKKRKKPGWMTETVGTKVERAEESNRTEAVPPREVGEDHWTKKYAEAVVASMGRR